MAYTVKSFDQIMSDMVAWIVANSPSITDFTPGSVIRSFCEGASLSMEEIYVSTYLGFRRNLNNIQDTVFDFPRKDGTKATVNVVFSRDLAGALIIIPAGTRVATASGLRYTVDVETSIDLGDTDSPSVSVTAEEVGSKYNTSSGTITVIEDTIVGVDSVTNALAATGGIDTESDIAYKNRFQAYVEGLGRTNVSGLRAGALSVPGITSASIVELFPPIAGVNVDLYVDDGTAAGITSEIISTVQTVINGDGTNDNPGYRAAGINVEVKQPGIVSQTVTATLSIIGGVDTDQLQADVVDELTGYVNTLGVGSNIIYNELVAAVMSVFGVSDVDISVPSANVTIAATQVGRLGAVTLLGL